MLDGLSLDEFVRLARAAGLAVLATVSSSGQPEAALMEMAVSDRGELVLDTPAGARKLANIAHDGRVAVVVGWSAGVSIQVEGDARIVIGGERARYEQIYAGQWPSSRVSDPSVEVVVVTPAWARHYDTTAQPARKRYANWLSEMP